MKKERYLEAAALAYSGNDEQPPHLVALGREEIAARMVAIARRHGIPVVEEPELCTALAELPIDEQIPSDLFRAAAVVLAKIGVLRR